MRGLLVVVAVVVAACGKGPMSQGGGDPPAGSATPAAGSAATAGSAQVAAATPADAAAPVAIDAAAAGSATAAGDTAAAAPTGPEPPLATDVLPSDEATPEARVAIGDGFLFQYPASFTRVTKGGGIAYTGSVHGFTGDATLTIWATSEPYTGDYSSLWERESKAAAAAGGTLREPDSVEIGIGTQWAPAAKRVIIDSASTIELRTMTTYKGTAYVWHCVTANVDNAWANVGSDCIARSATLHLAPPKLKKVAPPVGGPPPETPGIAYLASKVNGKARSKDAVNAWMDTVAPYVKPCIAQTPKGSSATVKLELAPGGAPGKVSIDIDDKPATSGDGASCVVAALASRPITGKASGAVKVEMVFVAGGG